jgi:CRP/FNR family cyclic AMP-dependent transcriptional regulator
VSTGVAARVAAHPFLAGMDPGHRAALAAEGTAVRLPAGHRVFAEGAPADRFWLLESGRVALDVPVPGNADTVVETLAGPTVLGWSWLLPPYRWHFGAVARTDVEAVAFDAASVRRRCAGDPRLGYALLTRFLPVLADRLHATRVRLLDLYGPPGRTR